ncbi:hypothetical protein [Nocardia sp. NPDC047038]|uniref:hypothetical protein n=1 Tax=Nocardia sp. NPDC047038 TaxID=3154338 RepID=UPI00340A6654
MRKKPRGKKTKMRKIVTVAAGLVITLGISSGSASAQADDSAVAFTASATSSQSIVQTDAGSMVVEEGMFEIKSGDGITLAGMPLAFRVDDFEFPIVADIAGRTAILTPQFDLTHAIYKPVALPFEDKAPWKTEYDREQAAWTRMTSTIAMGATLGTLIGGLGGAAAGCVLGGIAGATVAAAAIVGLFGAFIPAAVIGCLGGIIAVGAVGAVAGQLSVTAPVAISAVIQYFATISEPLIAPTN